MNECLVKTGDWTLEKARAFSLPGRWGSKTASSNSANLFWVGCFFGGGVVWFCFFVVWFCFCFLTFIYLFILRQGFSMLTALASNSEICLPAASGIKSVYDHVQLGWMFYRTLGSFPFPCWSCFDHQCQPMPSYHFSLQCPLGTSNDHLTFFVNLCSSNSSSKSLSWYKWTKRKTLEILFYCWVVFFWGGGDFMCMGILPSCMFVYHLPA